MNVLYICKVSDFQANENQIDIPKNIALEFFKVPQNTIDNEQNIKINVCHKSDTTVFEQIEIQCATNVRFSLRLNSFMKDYGDTLSGGDLLVFEKIGRIFCVSRINDTDEKYNIILKLFDKEEKHMLLTAAFDKQQFKMTQELSSLKQYITAIKSKPFLILAGNSGTGKSRIVREFAFKTCPIHLQDAKGTTPGNYCMIEVKPNWHDSSELFGYYSNLQNKYIVTKLDIFIVNAWLNLGTPFFVCLDEMNLAPVEQYFAEFLSVLETRSRTAEDGSIVSGALIDKKYFKEDNTTIIDDLGLHDVSGDEVNSLRKRLEEEGLSLPPNLIVIGTVNMDDTTYQFSRKVIDRAMTIEMNGGNLKDMFGNSSDMEYQRTDDEPLYDLGARYINADEVVEVHPEYKDIITKELPESLEKVNDILKNTPFQISYRVLNELVVYLGVLIDFNSGKDIHELIADAFDNITIMKILPRIEGDSDMFVSSDYNNKDNKLKQLQALFSEDSKSYKKLEEMNRRLEASDFTRFWP